MVTEGYNRRPYVHGAVARLGMPGMRFADGPRGVVMGESTAFPVSMARGATWDPALEERIGEAIGAEMRAQGGKLLRRRVRQPAPSPRVGPGAGDVRRGPAPRSARWARR